MRFTTLLFGAALCTSATIFVPHSAVATPLPDAVPAEVFAAPPSIEGAQISPSGTQLAAKVLVNGRQTLVVTQLKGVAQPAAFEAGDVDVNWWRWVNDDWLLVGLGNTEHVLDQEVYITRVASLSADLKTFNKIDWVHSGQFADDVLWIAKDGSTRFLLSKQTGFGDYSEFDPSVYAADAATGNARLALGGRSGVYEWVADGAGNVRLGRKYDYALKRSSVLYRPASGGEFSMHVITDANDLPVPLVFRADGSAVTIHDQGGLDEVYEMSLPGFTLGKKLFGVPGYDVAAVRTNDQENNAIGVRYVANRTRFEWFDPAHKDIQAQLDLAVGRGNGRIVSEDRSGTKLIVDVGAPSQAGGIFYWDTTKPAPSLLGWKNAKLQARRLSPVKSIRYKSRDGTSIEAVLTLPREREASKLPLIVLPHGGPGARDEEQFDWWSQYLAEQGYAVIQPNYRGSIGYGNDFYKLGEGQWGLKMQDDLIDAIAWASAQGIADPKRVCIVGGSYGGYAAMRGAQRDGSHYRCAISYAGVSDLKAMMSYDRQFLIGTDPKEYWKKRTADFAGVSPRFHPADFTIPIFIAHGVKDKRVPIKQSRTMVVALQKAGKTVTYLEQKEGDHHFSREEDRLEFLNAMKVFLDKYNPA